jgi:hypothetical protein
MTKCSENNVTHYLKLTIPEVPHSSFGSRSQSSQDGYNFMTWIKHELMYEALMVAHQAFYFDIDVLILKNPWPEVTKGRTPDGQTMESEYDVMYQRERGMKEKGCGGSVNSGVLYFRNSTKIHTLLKPLMMVRVIARESIILGTAGRLDQDILGDHVHLLRYCTFPVNKFAGKCESSRDPNGRVQDLVTFHANCVSGHQKYDEMKNILNQFKS